MILTVSVLKESLFIMSQALRVAHPSSGCYTGLGSPEGSNGERINFQDHARGPPITPGNDYRPSVVQVKRSTTKLYPSRFLLLLLFVFVSF